MCEGIAACGENSKNEVKNLLSLFLQIIASG